MSRQSIASEIASFESVANALKIRIEAESVKLAELNSDVVDRIGAETIAYDTYVNRGRTKADYLAYLVAHSESVNASESCEKLRSLVVKLKGNAKTVIARIKSLRQELDASTN